MKKMIMLVLLALAIVYGSLNAQSVVVSDKTGWHKIGSRTIDFKNDKDEITVLGADRFSSIKFKVNDAPVNLQNVEVYYESGDNQNIAVNSPIGPEMESKAYDLNGGERSLKKISFDYNTLPNIKDEKAEIEVWGLKTNADEKK
jgi:hypothetical protein